ncbi:MAG: AI-2E family transporter, partial [Opitutus sp.]
MPAAKPIPSSARFITFASFILVIAALRFAEDVMIPIALALLLAFLLTPIVERLMRWRLPRTLAITMTAGIAFLIIAVGGWQITKQAVALLGDIPGYERNLHDKIVGLKRPEASDTVSRALTTLEKMWGDLQGNAASAPLPATPEGAPKPVPVEVKPTTRTSFEIGREILGGLVKPLGTAGIVIVFVIAILFQREDLRNRFIRVISGGQLNIATEAVDDAAQRVSRYLLAQLMVNTCFGITIGLGLWAIGVPHAPLWGLLSTILRFIPFLGPMIAASFPLVLAVVVDPGWSMLFWTAGLFIAAELVTNNVVEVLVYGTSTGISTLALLIAAVFWSWLWGLPGLFLSTPMTVCLLVLGQYMPGLKFLSVLLGSEPPLQPAAQFYQSMLSMNQESMFDVATDYVEQLSLTAFYDDVFVPALLMSEVDRHNGLLAEVRQKFMLESGRELIEDLSERTEADERARAEKNSDHTDDPPVQAPVQVILGIPARDEADELVALMLGHLLRTHGVQVDVMSATADPE